MRHRKLAALLADEFIVLDSLLPAPIPSYHSTPDPCILQLKGDQIQLTPRNKVSNIRKIEQWTAAFYIFAAIHSHSHPNQTADIMKYASIVHTLTKRSGFAAAMFYDSSFRQWKQRQPALEWGTINGELYMQAVAMGLHAPFAPPSNHVGPPFRQSTPQRARCWEFTQNVSCPKSLCRYAHTCTACNDNHHINNCPKGGKARGGPRGGNRGIGSAGKRGFFNNNRNGNK